jgi:ribosomal protein L37E
LGRFDQLVIELHRCAHCGYLSNGMMRRMNSSKSGTVNAVSP